MGHLVSPKLKYIFGPPHPNQMDIASIQKREPALNCFDQGLFKVDHSTGWLPDNPILAQGVFGLQAVFALDIPTNSFSLDLLQLVVRWLGHGVLLIPLSRLILRLWVNVVAGCAFLGFTC